MIIGGLSGDGNTRADAIDFTGGTNTLDLSTGTLTGNIGVDGVGTTLDFNQTTAATLANVIAGTGAIIDSGTGTLTLTGANTYTGGTTIASGTLQLGDGTATGSIIGNVVDGGTLAFDEAPGTPLIFSGIISNNGGAAGAVTQIGGTTVLSGQNTYTGGTSLDGGTLELGQQSSAGTGAITFGTGAETLRLDFAGSTAAPVMGFAAGDDLDLTAVSSAATDSYVNGVLTVSDGTDSNQITIAAPSSGDEYQVSNDGSGHALVTLAAISTPTFTAPAQNSDTNNDKPTISGTGVSGDTVDLTISNGNGNPTLVAAPVTNGVWNYTPATALPDGNYAVFASQRSPSGTGSSPQVADGFTVDTTAPTVAITSPGGSTNQATQTITGTVDTADAGTTVSLFDNGGKTVVGTGVVQQNGTWTASVTLVQGSNALVAEDTDAAGNTGISQPVTYTLDTTAPTITAVADSGSGVTNGNGDLNAGKTVALTVTTSEAVYVQGGTPTLTLNDGGTATYTGPTGTATNTLTFSYTVAAGQNTSALAVTAVNANGATVADAAGNPINPSLMGAAVPSGTLVIDTTAPVASSPTLTVAQNAAATPIGIAAPSDNLTAAGSLAIVAGSLPTDGTVTLGDGTTPVTAGQALTVAQLSGLEFSPTAGVSNQGSIFTYTVTDGAGNAITGTAALNVGSPGAPTITGTHATATMSEAAVTPFAGVTVADPSTATETLNIALTGPGGTLTGAGLTANSNGTYQIAGTAAIVTTELDGLSFTPATGAAGTTSTTTFVLTDVSTAGTSVTNAGTSVTDTDPVAPPPPPAPPPSDAVSIDPAVTYKGGIFTLTGTASSAAGVSSVEISADVDGTRQDLGAATVNASGTFAFSDAVGDQQTFFVATLTDGAGGQAMSGDPGFNLTGGLGPTGGIGKAEDFDATGQVSTTLYRSNGTRFVGVEAANQTLVLQPFDIVANHHQAGTSFVYTPGVETGVVDVIHGFLANGAGHDTIDLPSSDFTNLADVLRHTGDVGGSAFITDPKTGDAIRLAGVSTAELKAHPKDIAFHA